MVIIVGITFFIIFIAYAKGMKRYLENLESRVQELEEKLDNN